MMDWWDISTAPKDGTIIEGERRADGKKIRCGRIQWRDVGLLYFACGSDGIEPCYSASVWMMVDADKRAPEPTHWRPVDKASTAIAECNVTNSANGRTEYINGVALVCHENGAVFCLPRPCRHYQLLALAALLNINTAPSTQGFTTSRGRVLDETAARNIAIASGQLIPHGNMRLNLRSEDLW